MTVAQQTNPRSYPDATPRKVAFLGLGVMGWPMAGHLALAGHTVTVFNRTAAKAQAWAQAFAATGRAHHASTPREASCAIPWPRAAGSSHQVSSWPGQPSG